MQLVWIRIRKYRRFSKAQTLRFTGKLTALVGPNEAGKTSLLEILTHLNRDEAFARLDVTRGEQAGDQPLLEVGFFLEPADQQALGDIPGGKNVRWLKVSKDQEGSREFRIEPDLHRDLRPRRRTADQLRQALAHPLLSKRGEETAEQGEAVSLARQALAVLDQDVEDLSDEDVEVLKQSAGRLEVFSSKKAPKFIRDISATLGAVAALESQENPSDISIERLQDRMPALTLFDEANRSLQSSYELTQVVDGPPQALANLANVASLNLRNLLNAVQSGDQADVNTIETRANAILAERLEADWSQSGVRVVFRTVGTNLFIQIRDEEDHFSGLDERSDGLRQFVALLAFCTSRRVLSPILLIDEAEAHLHYDAQADLIDMLTRQQIAKKVVYTTHSMGCLPEDLGAGIRVVQPTATKSEIRDRFWGGNEPGFLPLLFGMGATTLAFLPVRAALLVEGPSDAILLPYLLRELAQRDHVGFQIVHGLATSSRQQVPVLKAHGSRVLYLVDNDEGGHRLAKWLQKAGVPQDLIFRIAPPNSTLHTVEDAIDVQLFTDAVNSYLKKWSAASAVLKPADLPPSNRIHALYDWCQTNGHNVPRKPDVAYEIVEILTQTPGRMAIDSKRVGTMRTLWEGLERKFAEL